jgi:hypothetical protein
MTWWTVGCAALILTALGTLAWWLNRQACLRDFRLNDEYRLALQPIDNRLLGLVDDLRALKAKIEQPVPTPPALWTGVILPTDGTNASVERHLRAAEDHAISGQEPQRGSSPPSRHSGVTSRGTSSTRRDRTSGSG